MNGRNIPKKTELRAKALESRVAVELIAEKWRAQCRTRTLRPRGQEPSSLSARTDLQTWVVTRVRYGAQI